MPEIGEIKRGKEIGFKALVNEFVWNACEDCGKERWVRLYKNQPISTRCTHCCGLTRCKLNNLSQKGEKHPNWKGGKRKESNGYIMVWLSPDDFFHPMAKKKHNYILEHRLIMAKFLGRNLQTWEVVHHKNNIRDDNRLENLQLVQEMQHKQITQFEKRIRQLEQRIILLEAENIVLRQNSKELEV